MSASQQNVIRMGCADCIGAGEPIAQLSIGIALAKVLASAMQGCAYRLSGHCCIFSMHELAMIVLALKSNRCIWHRLSAHNGGVL